MSDLLNNIGNIHKFDFLDDLSPNPLPLEFGNSLTTTEFIGKLVYNINNVIEQVNQLSGNLTKYTDIEITKVKKEIANNIVILKEEIISLIRSTEDKCNSYSDSKNEELEKKLNENIVNTKRVTKEELSNDYNSKIQVLDVRESKHYQELLTKTDKSDFLVVNPVDGSINNISTVLSSLYNFMRNAISCEEFDSMELTVSQFDSILDTITLSEFDMNNKKYIK